jgi:hypothetical protein
MAALAIIRSCTGVIKMPAHSMVWVSRSVGNDRTFTPNAMEMVASRMDPRAIVVTNGKRVLALRNGVIKISSDTAPSRDITRAASHPARTVACPNCT